ncbi:hypothetical protein BSKO_03883 [Bryopsis sp. KO-2023]|nr:hypothetical protein BSKO_03883 [Bryopsis sp. KO-2023]
MAGTTIAPFGGTAHLPVRCKFLSRRGVSGRRAGVILASSGKGFGEKAKPQDDDGVKMSKRGTMASRPGQNMSPKNLQKMAEAMSEADSEEGNQAAPPPRRPEMQEVPRVVNDRMLSRMLIFSGTPVALGFLLFPLFYYLKVVKGVDLPNSLVFVTQLLTFGGGLLGITYGAMSSSWSASREGSFLGIEEFKQNFGELMDRRNQG